VSKIRFLYQDADGDKCSTTGWIVWAHNRLLQRRQFATDGVRFFYQPAKDKPFIIVPESELPDGARAALDAARS
jgi:hypothetical protein